MPEHNLYDMAVVGGGLAGLALSIQSARAGYETILFEKEKYPFHKVCGEYISFESWNFLEDLGIPLSQMNLPVIRRLLVSAPNGKILEQDLPLGGFGVSRFRLDAMLAGLARQSGVHVEEQAKVTGVNFDSQFFDVQSSTRGIKSRVVAGTFGKRSNLDIKWQRKFTLQKPNKLNNYIAVKYHLKIDWPDGLIALHNFRNGYCGISQIEDGKCCLCYLSSAGNLAHSGNSIPAMERQILQQNPHLKEIFEKAENLFEIPVTISQVSFSKKTQIQDHVLMVGDAAGMITPLCGNGMSMALHGSKLAFEQVRLFLQDKIPRWQMEQDYARNWHQQFNSRLNTGRIIQRFFGKESLSNLFISLMRRSPWLSRKMISQTHGQPY